jgi:hypothetical protein
LKISLRTAGSGERRVFPEATANDGTQPVTEPRMRGLELSLSPRILAQPAELIEQRHYLYRADSLPGFIVFGHHLDGIARIDLLLGGTAAIHFRTFV